MTYPTVFANLSGLNNPASLFDTMFNIMGQQGNIPCTAVGSNSITLTPNTNYYVPASYTDGQLASFKAVGTSTGSVSLQIGGLSTLPLYQPGGTQAGAGNIVTGTSYLVQYWGFLNSGAGGFQIINTTAPSVAQPYQAGFKNLKITNNNSTTQVTATADQVVVWNSSNGGLTLTSYAPPVINILNSGVANGLDTGAVASASWYAVYAIYNPTTTTAAGLLSLSGTSPTLPAGYTYSARIGWVRTQTGGTSLLNTLQYGRVAQYQVTAASTTTALPNICNGINGSTWSATAPVYVAASVSSVVPTTASRIDVVLINKYNNGVQSSALVAPNNAYSGPATTNPPPIGIDTANIAMSAWMTLESTNVYYAASAAGGGLFCSGWEDNL